MNISPLTKRIVFAFSLAGLPLVAFLVGACSRKPTIKEAGAPQRTIPEMLMEIDSCLDPETFPFMNATRAESMKRTLESSASKMPLDKRIALEYKYADELLNAGKPEDAVTNFKWLEQDLKNNAPAVWPTAKIDIWTREAVAYLRMGEKQNCCDLNNASSCLVPISGGGIHVWQEGSRKAIDLLIQILYADPKNAGARWLLNLAYMTIGKYPQGVPSQWLIPPKVFGGESTMPRFYNAAADLRIDLLGVAGSVALEDFEGNGLLGLVISNWLPGNQLRYFRNNGDGTFTERTEEAGLIGQTGGLNMIMTDYNNDGRPDVIVLRGGWFRKSGHYPLTLLRNDGQGHFTDVTIPAGLLTVGPTQTAVAFDYNSDGLLDLFVGYESSAGDPVPCKLFRNKGDGTFTDVTSQCGLNIIRFVKAAVSADFLHTGRPGLYLSCDNGKNILLRNDGPAAGDKSPTAPWKFTDITREAGVDQQVSSFSSFFFDYDNDGWPDIYVGGYKFVGDLGDIANDYLGLPSKSEKARLYHNNRNGTFTDVSKQAHLNKVILGMGLNYGDLDNDGWLDFYVGTGNPSFGVLVPNRMFRNHDGRYFDEVTTTGNFGHLQKGHGVAFGDIDNNGQQDIFEVMGGAYEGDTAHDCLYVNPGNKNHWVTLTLEGVKSNRVAIGAEICVQVITPKGKRSIYRTVSPGGSFGNNPLRQEMGLGDATGIEQVTIRWPASGITQVVRNLERDRFYKIREGEENAERQNMPTFKLPTGPAAKTNNRAASLTPH